MPIQNVFRDETVTRQTQNVTIYKKERNIEHIGFKVFLGGFGFNE